MAYILNSISKLAKQGAPWFVRLRSSTPSIVYSEEVSQAQSAGRPLVALESTIITHGMPYPHNLETALQVEQIIRDRGAIPATIAILSGQLTVGLTRQQIEYLSQAKGVVKASRRDLAPIAAAALDGATTVAGTLVAAELAHIPVFVTGGIGGVHRNGETSMDISADLTELGRSSTLVVCSGVKSILDIERTLEYLETQGVCVCAFGTSEFPAFYTIMSGHQAPHKVADAREAARLLQASHNLHLKSGIIVAVPLPKEYAMDEKVIEVAIAGALKDADSKGIRGKEVTPFILAAVAHATAGKSLQANMALIKNNAKVGADIAVEFNKLRNVCFSSGKKFENIPSRKFHTASSMCVQRGNYVQSQAKFGPHRRSDDDVLVIGGANVDRTYRVTEQHLHLDGSTHPSTCHISGGGVGRNMAEALWRLRDGRARLLTALGDDADGRYIEDIAPGLLLDGCIIPEARTATYAAVLNANGECKLGLGDMTIHNHISIDLVNKHLGVLEKAPLVVLDGNVPQQTIDHVLQVCHQLNKPLFFEPTDRRKAVKTLYSKRKANIISPNISELHAMATFLNPIIKISSTEEINEILNLSKLVLDLADFLIITLGSNGVLTIQRTNNNKKNDKVHFNAKLYPVNVIKSVKNVSGAGDCFASGFIYGILSGYKESECINVGFEAAKCSLLSDQTVPTSFKNIVITEASYKELSS